MKIFNDYHSLFFFVLCVTVLVGPVTLCLADIFIPAGNENIYYIGRFDFSDSSHVRFTWSGTSIKATFAGTSIGIHLRDGQGDYDVTIDKRYYTTVVTNSLDSTYVLASDLAPDTHTVIVSRRNEGHWNPAIFSGFVLNNEGKLLPQQEITKRKIEFIGDSYTAGYGNESPSRTCTDQQLRAYTNTNKSFGPLIAASFNAECFVLGWSGKGMVRNYGDSNPVSSDPYPVYYDKTLGALDDVWDFTRWVPNLVVICLGTNDFSTTPHPEESVYKQAYHDFIKRINGNYPEASILCVATHTDPVRDYVKDIVTTEIQSGNAGKVSYAEFPENLAMTGCHWHPDTSDDKKIAQALCDSIVRFTGWQMNNSNNERSSGSTIRGIHIHHGAFPNNRIHITIPFPCRHLDIFDTNGKRIRRFNVREKQRFNWETSGIRSGVYFICVNHHNRRITARCLVCK